MKIKRFVAKDMRTALAEIKEVLGAEAVIMSNKRIPEGVELMAAIDPNQVSAPPAKTISAAQQGQLSDDVVNLTSTANSSEQMTQAPADSLQALLSRQAQATQPKDNASNMDVPATNQQSVVDESNDLSSIEAQLKQFTDKLQYSAENTGQTISTEQETIHATLVDEPSLVAKPHFNTQTVTNANEAVNIDDFQRMKDEMASIRQLLEHQVSGLMWQDMAQKDPNRAVLINRLMALGVNESLAEQVAGFVPPQLSEQAAWQNAQDILSQQLNTTNNDIIHRGGVVSLVGPTGVGKTTTLAKLAARYAQAHGAEHVALISTDTYRIGGFEQLETYGKIIGCQVKLAKDAKTLDQLIQQFANKKLILIDTAGMGQRDMRLAEHLATLVANSRIRIRNYLVLAANTQQRVMQENVERFKKIPLCGCIYTKLDESLSMGEIITTSIQNGLPIGYLTDGQRVPEDIKVANAAKLVSLANKIANKSAVNNSFSAQRQPIAAHAMG